MTDITESTTSLFNKYDTAIILLNDVRLKGRAFLQKKESEYNQTQLLNLKKTTFKQEKVQANELRFRNDDSVVKSSNRLLKQVNNNENVVLNSKALVDEMHSIRNILSVLQQQT